MASESIDSKRQTAELFGVLATATDLGVGLPMGHTLRVARIATAAAGRLGLNEEQRADVYFTAMLKDAGCTSWATQTAMFLSTDEIVARREFLFSGDPSSMRDSLSWVLRYVGKDLGPARRAKRVVEFMAHGRDFTREGYLSATEVAGRIAERMGLGRPVRESLLCVYEQWDGKGMPRGLRGEAIPLPARIVLPSIYAEVAYRTGGPDLACALLHRRRGGAFDSDVADVLSDLLGSADFNASLEEGSTWEAALGLFPRIPRVADGVDADAFALTMADFVGMKAPFLAGHCRRVGDLAKAIAERLGLAAPEVSRAYRAGLLHDAGLVGVPSFVLNRAPDELSPAERRTLLDHDRRGAELIARASLVCDAVDAIARHHDFWGAEPVTRIVGAANLYDELAHDMPGRLPAGPKDAIAALERQGIDETVLSALRSVLGDEIAGWRGPMPGLSARETEVLALAASGLSRKEIADRLLVAESTVRHHFESIYRKLGVSSRVAAVLAAIEHGLLQ